MFFLHFYFLSCISIPAFLSSFLPTWIPFCIPFCFPFFFPAFIHSFMHSLLISFVHSFLPTFLPSILSSSFIHSFIHLFAPSFFPSFLLSFLPSFLPPFLRSLAPFFSRCRGSFHTFSTQFLFLFFSLSFYILRIFLLFSGSLFLNPYFRFFHFTYLPHFPSFLPSFPPFSFFSSHQLLSLGRIHFLSLFSSDPSSSFLPMYFPTRGQIFQAFIHSPIFFFLYSFPHLRAGDISSCFLPFSFLILPCFYSFSFRFFPAASALPLP